jgi:NADH-quinone oxidoreductase subunit L
MPEYSGSLPSFELAVALWLAPLLPLVAAVYAGIGGHLDGGDDASLPRSFRPRTVGLVAALAAFGLVAFHVVVLLGLPADQRQLVSHAWGGLRIGSVDSSLAVSGDATTLGLAFVACVAALAGFALALREPSADERRLAAGLGLALGGGLLVLLGDDLLLLVVGSVLSGLGALILARGAYASRAARGFVLARFGDAALLCAGAALLWGVAGGFADDGGYVPDFRARLASVQLGDAPASAPASKERGVPVKDAYGSLSMAALPGSSVLIGGAELCALDSDGKRGGVGTATRPCKQTARSPFSRLPLPVALHDIEVRTGPGTHNLTVEKTRVSVGTETLITTAGATLVLRELRDQLALRDASGGHVLRASLGKRRMFGQPLLGLVGALLGAFALLRGLSAAVTATARAGAQASLPGLVALAAGLELVLGAAVLLRLDFLFTFVPGTAGWLALVAAIAALWAASRAAHGFDLRATLALVAVANAGLSLVAAVLGAHTAAALGLVVTSLGLVGLVLALAGVGAGSVSDLRELAGRGAGRPRLVQALFVAGTALAGAPLPLVGVHWARDGALAAAAGAGSSVGHGVLGAAALATGLTAFAVWRVVLLVAVGKPAKPSESPAAASRVETPALAAGLAAIAFGALGAASDVVGRSVPALLETWLASPAAVDARGVPVEATVRQALAALALIAAVIGFALARARYGARRSAGWAEREKDRPLARSLAESPEVFDRIAVAPALAAARVVQRFDVALESLWVGGARTVAEPAGEPAAKEPESEAPPVSAPRKKRKGKSPPARPEKEDA